MSSVQSVERAFAIVGCLAGGTSGVSEIADRIALPKSTVARLLTTLVELGVAEQVGPGGRYRLGEYLHGLAAQALPARSLVAAARPHLAELVHAVGEAAGLSILDGDEVLYLDQVNAGTDIQVRDWTNERVPFYAVSSGLVLLARLPAATIDAVLDGPLVPFTDRTVTDPAVLRERLDAARKEGVVWVRDELSVGLSSVAAPVLDPNGGVMAAVHVHGPTFRFPGEHRDEVSARVRATADRIAAIMAPPRANGARRGN